MPFEGAQLLTQSHRGASQRCFRPCDEKRQRDRGIQTGTYCAREVVQAKRNARGA